MAKKRMSRTSGKRKTGTSLRSIPLSDLQAEVSRRASQIDDLIAEREELEERIASLNEQIQLLGAIRSGAGPARRGPGRPPKKRGRPVGSKNRSTRGRKRAKNSMSLSEAMAKVLKGKTMGVTEAAEAVQKFGYKTNSPNFRTIVNQTLIKDDRFKKVARGQYTAA